MQTETDHPFEQTENGYYRVIAPVDGLQPDSITVRVKGEEYTLTDCLGTQTRSKIQPDVLLYEHCSVV